MNIFKKLFGSQTTSKETRQEENKNFDVLKYDGVRALRMQQFEYAAKCFVHAIELNADDLLRRSIIQSLMCHFELSIESIEIAHLIDFRKYFATELDDLREMVDAGLVRVDDKWISVLPRGRMLVRAISMVFDRYLRADRQRTRYSKVI